ncbi:hypothetical protein CEP54_007156 [Fusarium duplospermum]|uniref:Uncharacterized protein n=1 Tax=Fusarium duplospermum TaxID=1325734 RepID=A0A428Q388_9HYPO|nr:hypothetical protein CEP54_007156 [Fusarium duplospermum]
MAGPIELAGVCLTAALAVGWAGWAGWAPNVAWRPVRVDATPAVSGLWSLTSLRADAGPAGGLYGICKVVTQRRLVSRNGEAEVTWVE